MASTNLSARRILVVDDCKDAVTILKLLLVRKGNEVRVAYDGLQALKLAEEFRPEICLLDISIPTLSGYELARKIREQPWGGDMILIAITGWGQDKDRLLSQEAGFNYHILKPVDLAALENLLAEPFAVTP